MKRFVRDRRGAYAVEFGLVAMPFLGLVCATMEVSWVSFNNEQLQAAVSKAARQVMTGQAQIGNYSTAASFVSNLLCPTSGRILPQSMDCSKLIVDVRTAADFTTTDMTNDFYNAPVQYCLGAPSTIVIVRVAYPMPAIFPLSISNKYLGLTNDYPGVSGWNHVIMGSAAVKTEPYQGSVPSC